MKNIVVLLMGLIIAGNVLSQDCVSFFPMNEGAFIETKNYSSKDKIESTTKQTIVKKDVNGSNVTLTVNTEMYDDKDKLVSKKDYNYGCKDGVFYIDMQNFIDQKTVSQYNESDLKMEATNLELPATMTPGQSLNNANINITVTNSGMTLMNMSVRIFNRKVATQENITTPAGTFNCYKIIYDVETKMLFKVQAKGIMWVADNVGVVRSENYDSKGKLQSYSVISALKN